MAITHNNELVSGSGGTITLRQTTGISGSTSFGTGASDNHNFTGSVYVSGTLYANTYRVNTIDTSEGSTIFGNDSADTHQFTGSVRLGDDSKLFFGAQGDVTVEYDENDTNTLLYAGADMRFSDDVKLQFGAAGDASIEYDEDGTDQLRFAGAATIFESVVTSSRGIHILDDQKLTLGTNNDITLEYDEDGRDLLKIAGTGVEIATSIGMGPGHGLHLTGAFRPSTHVFIADDSKIYFGAANDASIEYDEDGTDQLRFAGAATIFETVVTSSKGIHILDDQKVTFGTGADASIEYDENGTDKLSISGSTSGINIDAQGGNITVSGSLHSKHNATFNAYANFGSNVTVTGSLFVADNQNITLGTNNDIKIRYDEDGDDRLHIEGSGVNIATSIGMGPGHGLHLTGAFHPRDDIFVDDDKKIYFGAANDASIEYDEDGTDQLRFAGSPTIFETVVTASGGIHVLDDQKVTFGTGADASIEYREVGDNLLVIAGSSTGAVVSGSNLHLESHGSNLRLYSYVASGMGPQNGSIFLTGSAIYTPDESSLVLGDAIISNETGILTIDSPGVTVNDRAVAPNVTFEVHYTGSKNPTSLSNDTGGGEVIYMGSGSTRAGYLYYMNTDGGWARTNANATGSLLSTGAGNASMLGIALGADPKVNGMLAKGFFDIHTAYSGTFFKGQAVYVCAGAAAAQGVMSGAAPTAEDSYVRIVGYGTDTANVIYFNPDSTWVENS